MGDDSVDSCNAQHLLNSMRAPSREFGTLTHCGTGEKCETCEVACTIQMPGAAARARGRERWWMVMLDTLCAHACAHMCITAGGDQLTVQLLSNCKSDVD